jgi:hypothetical protein
VLGFRVSKGKLAGAIVKEFSFEICTLMTLEITTESFQETSE